MTEVEGRLTAAGATRRGRLARGLPPRAGVALSQLGRLRHLSEPPLVVHALVPIVIGALWALAVRGVRLRAMTDLGLVSVLPATTTLLLFVLTASFALSLVRRPLRPIVPLAHVVVLVVLLYGVTAFLEAEPRFSSVYRHVGIIDYIAGHHSVDPDIDAYFSWPGFFVLGAFVSDVAGFGSPLAMAAWGPLAFNLLFLVPLIVLFRWASDDPRVTWGGLWVFYSTNWVAQDYIAPQAVGFLLWLSMLGALLVTFAPRPPALPARAAWRGLVGSLRPYAAWLRSMMQGGDGRDSGPAAQVVGVFVALVLIYAATVTGHQLSPFPALLTVTGLVLLAGLRTRGLPVVMAVMLGAWISYMTTKYLKGHFGTVAGPVGAVGGNLNQNTASRVAGSPDHQLIVHIRILATAAIWGLAALGFARRLRARRGDVALVLIGTVPFLLPVLQPYGGEMLLRVFLFTLPAAAFFIACLAFPSPTAGRGWRTAAVGAVVGCALLWAFQYTRYGNERLDHFTTGDLAAVRALYRIAPPGSQLFAGTQNVPWRYRDYATYEYKSITDLPAWRSSRAPSPRLLARELEEELPKRGGYVIVTRSTRIDAELRESKLGALEGLVRLLRRSPLARPVYRARDGQVFFVRARA